MKKLWGRIPEGPISRETALGCMATNIAVPGFGTILTGKVISGVAQLVLALAGMGLSMAFGLKMLVWMLANWNRIQDPYGDPLEKLTEMWGIVRWPLAGILLFAIAWIWAFLSSLIVLRKAGKAAPKRTPPPL